MYTFFDHMMAANICSHNTFPLWNVEHKGEYLMKAFVCFVLSNFPWGELDYSSILIDDNHEMEYRMRLPTI